MLELFSNSAEDTINIGKIMKNNKGITLLEVIVSIVILGITIVSTIQVMATNNRVVIRNERNLNSIQEVESIMEIFSSDPEKFINNLTSIYENIEVSDKIYLYYSSAFIKNSNNSTTAFYLEVLYNKEVLDNKTKYILTINTYYDGVKYIHNNNTNSYNERVIVK